MHFILYFWCLHQVFAGFYQKTDAIIPQHCQNELIESVSLIECILLCERKKYVATVQHSGQCYCSSCDFQSSSSSLSTEQYQHGTSSSYVILKMDEKSDETVHSPKTCDEARLSKPNGVEMLVGFNDPIPLDIGGYILPIVCYFTQNFDKWSIIIPPGEWIPSPEYFEVPHGASKNNPYVYNATFTSISPKGIEKLKQLYVCQQRIDIDFHNVRPSRINFVGWDDSVNLINNVPSCEGCAQYLDGANIYKQLIFAEESFIPIKEIIISDVDDTKEYAKLINYYFYCNQTIYN